MSWWDNTFSNAGWTKHRCREQLVDGLDKGDSAASLERLFALDDAQADEIDRLRLTVRVLTEILVENMGLDAGLLHQRMTEAAEEARAGQNTEQLKQSAQSSEASEDESTTAVRARCSVCSAPAEVASTHFAKFGLVCDACHALGKPLKRD